jgi:hypothetical protein
MAHKKTSGEEPFDKYSDKYHNPHTVDELTKRNVTICRMPRTS